MDRSTFPALYRNLVFSANTFFIDNISLSSGTNFLAVIRTYALIQLDVFSWGGESRVSKSAKL